MGWTRWAGIGLGVLLVAAGVAETVRLTRSGDGGLVFWFGTLVGGGLLILVGALLGPRRPRLGAVLTVMGCILGVIPTAWTVIVPVLLAGLMIATLRQAPPPDV